MSYSASWSDILLYPQKYQNCMVLSSMLGHHQVSWLASAALLRYRISIFRREATTDYLRNSQKWKFMELDKISIVPASAGCAFQTCKNKTEQPKQ